MRRTPTAALLQDAGAFLQSSLDAKPAQAYDTAPHVVAPEEEELCRKLHNLLVEAKRLGYVVTVWTQPTLPLAQGNYRMVGDVRRSAKLYRKDNT